MKGSFSKSTIFNCFQFRKSESHPDYDCIFTVFLNFHPNRFCFIPEPHELVWRSVWSILHGFFGSIFYLFFKKWSQVSRFFRFQTPENRFSGLGTFLHVFDVQKFINLFTILQFLYNVALMLHGSFSYEPSRQYGISHFLKTVLKSSK